MTEDEKTALEKLREPFPAHQISKLPKEMKWQTDERKADKSKAFRCQICDGWHHRGAVHLDYVGHAALTDRLLDVDPLWNWEPLAFNEQGYPAFDKVGGLWIRLTVCGHTRLGYGNADGKQGGDAVKEVIGDALRNAAMRFGAALDLWHKGDLHALDGPEESESTADNSNRQQANPFDDAQPTKSQDNEPATDGLAMEHACDEVKSIARSLNLQGDNNFVMSMQNLKNTASEVGCQKENLRNAYNVNLEAIRAAGRPAFDAYRNFSTSLAKDLPASAMEAAE